MKRCVWILCLAVLAACGGSGEKVQKAPLSALEAYRTSDAAYTLDVKGCPLELVFVDGGYFSMGHTLEQGVVKNPKIKPVLLDGFAIGRKEVSQGLWKAVMGRKTVADAPDEAPVTQVSWDDATAFCAKLSKLTGLPFRLGNSQCLQNGHDIVFHRKFAENGWFLRQIPHPQTRPLVHHPLRDIFATKSNRASIRSNQPDNHVEARGLARAVRPEKPHYLPSMNLQAHVVDDAPPPVYFRQANGL